LGLCQLTRSFVVCVDLVGWQLVSGVRDKPQQRSVVAEFLPGGMEIRRV
jgi:hypothetical protein